MTTWISDNEFLILTNKAGDEVRRASCRFNLSEAEIRAYVLWLLKQGGKLVAQRKTKQGVERTIRTGEFELVLVWGERHGQIQWSPDGKRRNVFLVAFERQKNAQRTET